MAKERLISLDSYHANTVLGGLSRDLAALPRGLDTVVVRSLNRAITAMREETAKGIREEYAVPMRDVKATMRVQQANRGRKVASLTARGRMSIPLIRWKAKQTKKGVTVAIHKGAGRRLVAHKQGKPVASFMGREHVFARPELAARNQVRRLYGPSFLSMLKRPEVQLAQQGRAVDVFEKRVIAEANHLLSKVAP
jgi:hypothetical protein